MLLLGLAAVVWIAWPRTSPAPYSFVSTIAGVENEFGEPFGIAERSGVVYVSDGQNDKIWRIERGKLPAVFAAGLATPSAIAFGLGGDLIVADTGSHTIKSINEKGEITVIAGVPGRSGLADGEGGAALFNGPVGLAIGKDGRIFVADTYNDRIRVIDNGTVSTLAGSSVGMADGIGRDAKFDTPTGLAMWDDRLLVADTGNGRIRVVEPDGSVWTLAGTGESDVRGGLLSRSAFVHPSAISVDKLGTIYIADGNTIRQIGGTTIPSVLTVTDKWRGVADGPIRRSRFNRISGLAITTVGDLLATDSENRLLRQLTTTAKGIPITESQIAAMSDRPEEFRTAAPGRWPFAPPLTKRDIAGTLGEIRGEMTADADQVWFHNGLDIAGAHGETTRFIRDEKVLKTVAVENFGSLRELIRLPTLGYIHIRIGRDQSDKQFSDPRFQFLRDASGKLTRVRVPRGTKFRAGEPIGTLNPMNHVHLIAGRSGSEMNALDALVLPGISDSRPPVIEKVTFFDQNWAPVETVSRNLRIKPTDKTRIVVRAYDQVDGNAERRRLGVYKLGYQILDKGGSAVTEPRWNIVFDRMPSNAAVRYAYGIESHSGATGETIFNYIVTNEVNGERFREGFLELGAAGVGNYRLRVLAADYFGNVSSEDIAIEVYQ